MSTLILQSHRNPLPFSWLANCLDSVKTWAESNGYEYRFIGDDLFDFVDDSLLEKTQHQKVIATDLARLKWLQHFLREGYKTVVWCDADFLVFAPEKFTLPDSTQLPEGYALGREVWVQYGSDNKKKLKAYKKVHNAFLLFRQGANAPNNSFLDFYTDHAERLLTKTSGSMPPQFIGPKLLTAIHNVVQCPVMETAGMFSPLVIKDIVADGGAALDLFQQKSAQPCSAANLCGSMSEAGEVSDKEMARVIGILVNRASVI